jgi:flagellar motor switch protein FliN/FliY
MKGYLECWISAAKALFSQALAGGPELVDALPRPMECGTFGFEATLTGEEAGRFSVMLDEGILATPLLGEDADQRAGWGELLREVADAATGELLATTGRKCRVESFRAIDGESKVTRAFELKSASGTWTLMVRDEVRERAMETTAAQPTSLPSSAGPVQAPSAVASGKPAGIPPSVELLLDVELEAALRFGCREMPLGEILDLGPGDVVELDRHIADPVDLIVGDKIVARGEVVLINGDFGLRVTEIAEPRRRLESIRCLF